MRLNKLMSVEILVSGGVAKMLGKTEVFLREYKDVLLGHCRNCDLSELGHVFLERVIGTGPQSVEENSGDKGAEENSEGGPLRRGDKGVHTEAASDEVLTIVHGFSKLEIKSGDLVAGKVGCQSNVDGLASVGKAPLGVVIFLVGELDDSLAESLSLLHAGEFKGLFHPVEVFGGDPAVAATSIHNVFNNDLVHR